MPKGLLGNITYVNQALGIDVVENQPLLKNIEDVSSKVFEDKNENNRSGDTEKSENGEEKLGFWDNFQNSLKGFSSWVKSFFPGKHDYQGDPSKVDPSKKNTTVEGLVDQNQNQTENVFTKIKNSFKSSSGEKGAKEGGEVEVNQVSQAETVENSEVTNPIHSAIKKDPEQVSVPKVESQKESVDKGKGSELTEEEKEIAAVVKLLNGIKAKANGDETKEKELLGKASDLVANTKDQDLIKGWNEVLGKAAGKNPELAEMANNFSRNITAKDAARSLVGGLLENKNVDPKNVDKEVPTLEALAANPEIGNKGNIGR